MLSKVRQILNDHKAMNLIRENNGSVQLAPYASDTGFGWYCRWLGRAETVESEDPSSAIMLAEKNANVGGRYERSK